MTDESISLTQRVFSPCLALLLLAACSNPISTHILFIGNSFTYYNGGIDKQLKGLAPASASSVIAVGGYKLVDHWNSGDATGRIRMGGWDYVVLQEQSRASILDSEMFFNAVRDLDVAVRASGAHTILLMTWEYPDSVFNGVTTENLAAVYLKVGSEFDIPVAPVGLAFDRSLRRDLT